jgi:hypothetical protein
MNKIAQAALYGLMFFLIVKFLKMWTDGLALIGVGIIRTRGLLALPIILVAPYLLLPADEGFHWYVTRAFGWAIISALLASFGLMRQIGIPTFLPIMAIIFAVLYYIPVPSSLPADDTATVTTVQIEDTSNQSDVAQAHLKAIIENSIKSETF